MCGDASVISASDAADKVLLCLPPNVSLCFRVPRQEREARAAFWCAGLSGLSRSSNQINQKDSIRPELEGQVLQSNIGSRRHGNQIIAQEVRRTFPHLLRPLQACYQPLIMSHEPVRYCLRDEAKEALADARPQATRNRRRIHWNTLRICRGREQSRCLCIVRRSRTVNVGQAPNAVQSFL